MSINDLFFQEELSKTEQDIIVEVFANPAVKKYLRIMASEDTKELLAFSAISHQDPEISKALSNTQGKLSVLSTLLSIQSKE